MPENLHLVTELAIILIAAGVFTVISKALKQPVILGYIVAGFLVGPHLGIFPQFGAESIHEWSEIGIIFLMFGLGLDFSFKKLLKVGSNALITAGVTCVGMFVVGTVLSRSLGWSSMEGVFLGGLMGMSSTAIIIKAYNDMGLSKKPYATLVFGALVFEDLIAILLMVLLSALAVTGKFEGVEMLKGIVKLAFFLVLWFLVGIYLIPLLFKKARNFLSDEILLLVAIGLCFGMVVLANLAGFSSALGAFVMGSLLSETMEGGRIEGLTLSLKNLFAAIFFVSVGMMVDPGVIAQHWGVILVIAGAAIVGILTFSTCGALLAGRGVNVAVHTGFSLAQLGEFSFILAGLGCSLGVMRDFIYPVVVSASVITTFTTPFLIKLGDPVSVWLEKTLSPKILAVLNPKDEGKKGSRAEQSEWNKLIKTYILRLALYGVLAVAVVVAENAYLPKLLGVLLPSGIGELGVKWIDLGVSLILVSPFVYGIAVSGAKVRRSADLLLRGNEANRWPLMALICIRAMIATYFVTLVITSHFTLKWWSLLLLTVAIICLFVFIARRATAGISRMEATFMANLNGKEEAERRNSPVTTKVNATLSDYDITIRRVQITQDFDYIGKTLREMPFRKGSDANVIKIIRGAHSITVPRGDVQVYPGDVLLAVGTNEQLDRFEALISQSSKPSKPVEEEDFTVEPVTVTENSSLAYKTLRSIGMRGNGCMVISIVRSDGKQIANPPSDRILEPGDILWIAGEKSSVEWYCNE